MTVQAVHATLPVRILEAYGLSYRKIYPLKSGYRNLSYQVLLKNNQSVNVLIYKNEPDILLNIRAANAVSSLLFSKGLPSRRTLDKKLVCLRGAHSVRYAVLYNYLPGRTIPWEEYTKNHIKLTGAAMSALHYHLIDSPLKHNEQALEAQRVVNRMKLYFSDEHAQKAMAKKLRLQVSPVVLNQLEKSLALGKYLPGKGMLHMDFVRGNLLFEKVKKPKSDPAWLQLGSVRLSGIIDFEKTAYGHPVFDVARSLAFLLVDCQRYSSVKIYKYFLSSGYNKRGPARFRAPMVTIKHGVHDLLEDYVNFFLLYDFYKFLRHNPYEFLEQNHHFVRTRDILIARNMLKYRN